MHSSYRIVSYRIMFLPPVKFMLVAGLTRGVYQCGTLVYIFTCLLIRYAEAAHKTYGKGKID